MVIHPPMLYMGYVGFSVAFAFAVAALIGGNLDAHWARWTRPWTTAAWCFLTVGIALGSWLGLLRARLGRLVVLGPGRERVVHAVAGRHRADPFAGRHREARRFKSWTVLLAILAFSLSLLGTFLVRSGVLSSVHAFATDPTRGALHPRLPGDRDRRLAGALRLARADGRPGRALRAGLARVDAARQQRAAASSRCAAVLLGTLYPLVLDALGLGKISVGPPYFDTVFVPLMAPALFLMGVGPLARWKQAELPDLARRLRWAAGVARGRGARCAAGARRQLASLVGARAAAGVLDRRLAASPIWSSALRRPAACAPASAAALRADPARAGRHAARAPRRRGVHLRRHAWSSGYEVERDVRMDVGDTTDGRRLRLHASTACATSHGPNYAAARGHVEVTRDGQRGRDAAAREARLPRAAACR